MEMLALKTNKKLLYVLLLSALGMVAQSCSGSKKCGCGGDLNRVYGQPRHFR